MQIKIITALFMCAGALLGAPAVKAETPTVPELQFVEIPPTLRDRFIGDRISYMEAGKADGPVVLMLHGIGANSSYFRYQFHDLGDRYRMIAWNAPGYLLSDNLRKERPTCTDYSDALEGFVQAMGLSKFILHANSFGSVVAQCYIEQHPDRVSRLVMSGTSLGDAATPPDIREAAFQRRQKQFERTGGMGYARDVIGLVLSPHATEDVRQIVMRVLEGTSGPGYLQANFIGVDLDTLKFAPHIHVPVLLIHGSEDKLAPIDQSAVVLAKAVPTARLERLQGVGHLVEAEASVKVDQLLKDFYAQN